MVWLTSDPRRVGYEKLDTLSSGTAATEDIHLKLHHNPKSHEILSAPIVLKFCIEHDSVTVVHCARFRNDWKIETDVTGQLKQMYIS